MLFANEENQHILMHLIFPIFHNITFNVMYMHIVNKTESMLNSCPVNSAHGVCGVVFHSCFCNVNLHIVHPAYDNRVNYLVLYHLYQL